MEKACLIQTRHPQCLEQAGPEQTGGPQGLEQAGGTPAREMVR